MDSINRAEHFTSRNEMLEIKNTENRWAGRTGTKRETTETTVTAETMERNKSTTIERKIAFDGLINTLDRAKERTSEL